MHTLKGVLKKIMMFMARQNNYLLSLATLQVVVPSHVAVYGSGFRVYTGFRVAGMAGDGPFTILPSAPSTASWENGSSLC